MISDPPPQSVTHVYARQHNTRGLEERYKGPFKILDRPTRSTLVIKAGLTNSGEDRRELRSWADCKPAYRREDNLEASRPKRGRPPKEQEPLVTPPTTPVEEGESLEPDNNQAPRPVRSTRNPAPNYVDAIVATMDFTKPPPPLNENDSEPTIVTGPPPYCGFLQRGAWKATPQELQAINNSIAGVSRGGRTSLKG